MSQLIPWRILPIEMIIHQGPQFTTDVVMPWLYELAEHHHKFHMPPYFTPGSRPPYFDVKGTRWASRAHRAEILYYVATDPDGHLPARDDNDKLVMAWAETPVPLPPAMADLRVAPHTL